MYYEMLVEIGQKYGVKTWPVMPDGVYGFQSGDPITVDVPQPVEYLVDHTQLHPPTDLVTTYMLVFSDRLVEAFRNAGVDHFQTFRARLRNPSTGDIWDGYQTINILGLVACADLEMSEYEPFMGFSKEFKKLVIDSKKANGVRFFRLLESEDKIIVHDDIVKQMYTDNDEPIFEGINFEPIDTIGDK